MICSSRHKDGFKLLSLSGGRACSQLIDKEGECACLSILLYSFIKSLPVQETLLVEVLWSP